MTSRIYVRAAAIAAACLGLAVPVATAAADSGSGGAGFGSDTGTSTSTTSTGTTTGTAATGTATTGTATTAQTAPVGGPVSAAGNGFSLNTTAAGTFNKALTFSGSAPSSDSGDTLAIQSENSAGEWNDVADTTVASDGTFSVPWRASQSGLVAFRAAIEPPSGTAEAAIASSEPASPTLSVTIYRNAIATIYGPGLWGHKTACGVTLTRATLGVASRTLKCGTEVSIDYKGQSITVPVIDRGPYSNHATWDLTEAVAKALGDPETETVGAAVL